jgi:membrane-associated HD superfamily phosphohydrolase
VEKPTYFVENQKSPGAVTTNSSADEPLIIAAHVKDGLLWRASTAAGGGDRFHPHASRDDPDRLLLQQSAEARGELEDETKLDEINEEDYRYPGQNRRAKKRGS